MGKIYSPRHTLPPNTTCTYHFHGYPGDLIWLSFTSFNLQILQQAIHDNNTLGRVSKQQKGVKNRKTKTILFFIISFSPCSMFTVEHYGIEQHHYHQTTFVFSARGFIFLHLLFSVILGMTGVDLWAFLLRSAFFAMYYIQYQLQWKHYCFLFTHPSIRFHDFRREWMVLLNVERRTQSFQIQVRLCGCHTFDVDDTLTVVGMWVGVVLNLAFRFFHHLPCFLYL